VTTPDEFFSDKALAKQLYEAVRQAIASLGVGLRRRAESPRWKQVVESAPGRFTYHLELYAVPDVDAEVRAWLREAWEAAK
jgi:hypothetical protein